MASEEQIKKEARIFINNDLTVEETSTQLGISKRTFQLHMSALKVVDNGLYKLVKEKTDKLQIKGRLEGGKKGKRKPNWTKETALQIADYVIANELTYEEAEKRFGIPKSTIYEMLKSDCIDGARKTKLDAVVQANLRRQKLTRIVDENKRRYK